MFWPLSLWLCFSRRSFSVCFSFSAAARACSAARRVAFAVSEARVRGVTRGVADDVARDAMFAFDQPSLVYRKLGNCEHNPGGAEGLACQLTLAEAGGPAPPPLLAITEYVCRPAEAEWA